MRTLCIVALASCLSACAGVASKPARAQEAARDFNVNTHFGRTELVMERVAAKERAAFTRTHKQWGGEVQIADAELSGFHMTGDDDAEVTVRVAWYRPDEQELHVTWLKQKWQSLSGDWLLVGEERTEGTVGLLAEPVVRETPSEPQPPAQFPTIRLGVND